MPVVRARQMCLHKAKLLRPTSPWLRLIFVSVTINFALCKWASQPPSFGYSGCLWHRKTIVAALIAARLAEQGKLALMTSTTNVAVAQFTETLLKLDEYKHLKVLRFVADSALREGADLHQILRGLLANFSDALVRSERLLADYVRGRTLVERLLFDTETTLHLS